MRKALGLLILTLLLAIPTSAIDAEQFDDLEGYTVIACTHATELEGVDYDKPVMLHNGMVFELRTYSYFYAYRPAVVVFADAVQFQGKLVTLYKLTRYASDRMVASGPLTERAGCSRQR